jgi:glycyl-tRNA synthetase (class II)
VDYDTLRDGSVTIRDRDTKEQVRVMPSELKARLQQILAYPA